MQRKLMLQALSGAAGLALISALPAQAQSLGVNEAPKTSFSVSTQQDTWHTVLIVSAIVGIVGILDSDSTLTIIGGAGVLLSLYEMQQPSRFRFELTHRSADLFKTGPLSFGVGSFGTRQTFSMNGMRPGPYVQLSFRF